MLNGTDPVNPPESIVIDEVSISLSEFLCVFDQFASTAGAILFDSADNGEKGGRFSIALWHPSATIRLKDNLTVLSKGTEQTVLTTPPLEAAYDLMRCFRERMTIDASIQHTPLPFIVGLAGLCGYDLGRQYESLPSLHATAYRCPDMVLGLYEQSLVFDHSTQQAYYCRFASAPSFADALARLSPQTSHVSAFSLTTPWQSNLTQDHYCDAIARIHQYLHDGDCYQINFAQRFEARFQGDPWLAYKTLRLRNKSPFACFMRTDTSAILSLSPERFLAIKEGHVETKPIKGTRPRAKTPEADAQIAANLLSAEKDRAENLMIVDLLRNDLSKHCLPHSVKVPHLFALESYDAVHHMVSTVVGTLSPESHPLALFSGAFPGGSITGAPKVRAMEVIEELEPHQRNIYCGSMLYLGCRGDMDSSICIRTLLAEDEKLYCWAGGGIVMDSVAEEEYQETLDKVANILPVLGAMNES